MHVCPARHTTFHEAPSTWARSQDCFESPRMPSRFAVIALLNLMTWCFTAATTHADDHDRDNRSDQLNPNNDAYYQSRGEDGRPDEDDDDDGYFVSDDNYDRGLTSYARASRDADNDRADHGPRSAASLPSRSGERMHQVVAPMLPNPKTTNARQRRSDSRGLVDPVARPSPLPTREPEHRSGLSRFLRILAIAGILEAVRRLLSRRC